MEKNSSHCRGGKERKYDIMNGMKNGLAWQLLKSRNISRAPVPVLLCQKESDYEFVRLSLYEGKMVASKWLNYTVGKRYDSI